MPGSRKDEINKVQTGIKRPRKMTNGITLGSQD